MDGQTERPEKEQEARMDTMGSPVDSRTAPANEAAPTLGNEQLCAALNPLAHASYRLRAGHEGAHWGHGPFWTWDDTTGRCETVPPAALPPK